jgi:hypothetical protein
MTISPTFARHETFHPRVGWLSKAVHAVAGDPEVFLRDSAPVDLGVGKNMVRAIRYWAAATKVIVDSGERRRGMLPSALGRFLLGEGGVDPFAEDATTLWLLHWTLLREPATAPTWWWAFNEVDLVDFDQAQLARAEVDWILSRGWPMPARGSIERDVDCLIRMYSRRPGQVDPIDSPFASLGLIEPVVGASRRWRFTVGAKESLDARLVLFTSLAHMVDTAPEAQTIGIARLATSRGGPGRAFRLTDSAIAASLRTLASSQPEVSIAAPAGLSQLVIRGDKRRLAARVLADCYSERADIDTLPRDLVTSLDELLGPEPEGIRA